MNDNLIFNINLDLLLRAGITVNQYFIMQLIHNKKKELFRQYMEIFHKSPVDVNDLKYLVSKEFLIMKDINGKYTFENLMVTKLFTNLAFINVDDAIEELENTYPKKTPITGRRLHADKDKWSKKYLSIIKKDRTLHDKIILCIKAELQHRQKTDGQEYWALLSTYINNKRWEQYLDDIDGYSEESKFSKDI